MSSHGKEKSCRIFGKTSPDNKFFILRRGRIINSSSDLAKAKKIARTHYGRIFEALTQEEAIRKYNKRFYGISCI